jgi:geranylgeranyl diphosphate synthase type II
LAVSVTSELIPQLLREYGDCTRRALIDFLPSDRPQQRHLYDLLADYPQRGGKMMRPSMCIATARAFGADIDEALHTAVSIELLHNACLIHDDIEDDSEERRGKPTLHVLHGIPLAINAGDSLSLLALQPLLKNRQKIGSRLALRILEETERMACESSEGQAMELGWRWDNSVDLGYADYLTMVLKKTCWLSAIYPCRVGALIGSRDRVDLEPFIRFGFFLGSAFQIQDDLLNLIADERYGKEINGDIWEGKRTLMLIRLLDEATPDERTKLVEILRFPRHERTELQVVWIRRLMDKYDCIEHARQYAHALAGAAAHEYSRIYGYLPDSRDKTFIEGLVTWVFERT